MSKRGKSRAASGIVPIGVSFTDLVLIAYCGWFRNLGSKFTFTFEHGVRVRCKQDRVGVIVRTPLEAHRLKDKLVHRLQHTIGYLWL